MGVKLIKQGDTWVTEFLGKLRHFLIDSDLVTWRSMGIIPGAAIEFNIDLDGTLLTAKDMSTGLEINELEIPKRHALADTIKATKLYKEQTC